MGVLPNKYSLAPFMPRDERFSDIVIPAKSFEAGRWKMPSDSGQSKRP